MLKTRSPFSKKYLRPVMLLLIVWVSGCHTTKKTAKSTSATTPVINNTSLTNREILKKMRGRYIDYHTFSARLKIDIQSGSQEHHNITAFLRMKKDSIIWISIRPVLGIEMARVAITPDSIRLINNLKQTVYLHRADSIETLLHIPFNFKLLQELLIGSPASIPDKINNFAADSTTIYVTIAADPLTTTYQWSKKDFLLQESHFQINDGSEYVDQQFSNYESSGSCLFALDRDIRLQYGKRTHIIIKFNKILFDSPLQFPFNYSTHYKIR